MLLCMYIVCDFVVRLFKPATTQESWCKRKMVTKHTGESRQLEY